MNFRMAINKSCIIVSCMLIGCLMFSDSCVYAQADNAADERVYDTQEYVLDDVYHITVPAKWVTFTDETFNSLVDGVQEECEAENAENNDYPSEVNDEAVELMREHTLTLFNIDNIMESFDITVMEYPDIITKEYLEQLYVSLFENFEEYYNDNDMSELISTVTLGENEFFRITYNEKDADGTIYVHEEDLAYIDEHLVYCRYMKDGMVELDDESQEILDEVLSTLCVVK